MDSDSSSAADPGPPRSSAADLLKAARGGALWSFAGTFGTRIGTFVLSLVLARILGPEDFGVYAVALVVQQILIQLNDLGAINALVQWRGEDFQRAANTVAVLAVLLGITAYAGIWFSAPLVATFAQAPNATLVIRLVGISVLANSATAAREAYLLRTFQQRSYAYASFVGLAAQIATALPMALTGFGAVAFGTANAVSATALATAVTVFSRDFRLRWKLDRRICARLIRYGSPLAGALAIRAAIFNLDSLLVASIVGAYELGFYAVAFNIALWIPALFGNSIRFITFPLFSRIAEQGHGLPDVYTTVLTTVIRLTVPVILIICILSNELIAVLYGPVWANSAPTLSLLTLLMLVRVIWELSSDLLSAYGNTLRPLLGNVVWLVLVAPTIYWFTSEFGIVGAGLAHVCVAAVVGLPLSGIFVRTAGIRIGSLLLAIGKTLIPLIGCALALVLIERTFHGSFNALVGGAVAIAATYAILFRRQLWMLLSRAK